MRSRMIGDLAVGAVGLGAMELSAAGRPDRARALATVRAAVEAGVTLIDTADAYCLGPDELNHNELLVAEALRGCGNAPAVVLVATKGGHTRPNGHWEVDGRPEYIRAACDRSLRALGVEQIGLYQHHRPDPRVPYAETIGALRELRDTGKIRQAGISNVDSAQIRIAVTVLGQEGLASVQNEFSPRVRGGCEQLELCRTLGVAYLLYSPLGGMGSARQLGRLYPQFARVADAHGVSPQQVALAWELSLGPHVIPIPGSSQPATIRDCAAATSLCLSDDEREALNVG
jgi:aryl-alcohol dehydrogenase-like predicted oxidoreductase